MKYVSLFVLILLGGNISSMGKVHPCLILTKNGVKHITQSATVSAFDKVKDEASAEINKAITDGIDIPIPKDMAGGYTHEQHKKNYKNIALAGALYQITKEDKYAEFVKDMLLGYEKIFLDLPPHPSDKSYARGKLFWQCLNDANWLVFASQGYDAVYDYLSKEDQKRINNNLFKPYADYISVQNPRFFNRVHNHSTWGNAAVGMVGLVIGDKELVDRALYGLPIDKSDSAAYDNDGGLVYEKGKAGFFAQIDNAFSPDGYYEEGPYYQRYAMTPFMLFAAALQNNKPNLGIFAYRDSVLVKAVFALLNQTNQQGAFFPINDAQKGMSVRSAAVITAVNICYSIKPDHKLLHTARLQNTFLLNQYGFEIAQALEETLESSQTSESVMLSDGTNGDKGALMVLRTLRDEVEYTAVLKATGQGLGHGHFDKLGLLFYAGEDEVIQDYGSARWVNVEQKQGGRYLPENKTWAKQTVAHNTLVVDRMSHFNGNYKTASSESPIPLFFDASNTNFQLCVAKDTSAYPGVTITRYVILINDSALNAPLVIDAVTAQSNTEHTYELPYQFIDGYIDSRPPLRAKNELEVMGSKAGFEHLFLESQSAVTDSSYSFTWFRNKRFYTITSAVTPNDTISMARIGANDPEYHLRREALFLHHKPASKNAVFASVIEPHGGYNYDTEIGSSYATISKLSTAKSTSEYLVLEMESKQGGNITVCLALNNMSKNTIHQLETSRDASFNWIGPYYYNITKK